MVALLETISHSEAFLTMRDGQTYKRTRPTVRWTDAEMARLKAATAKLEAETFVPVTLPKYIKGAVEKRNIEILGTNTGD